MTTVVFVGPSIGVDRARRHLNARYLPPAEQGDVLVAMAHSPRVIAVIDGYFDVVPSVWHKEILLAMSQGVHVFGSSSMGALRAAELHSFGMVGVGEVFDSFRTGELEDDDEVAVVHGPSEWGFVPLSVAMVDMRDAFRAACAAGGMSPDLCVRLTRSAKALHYRERTFERVLFDAKAGGEDAGELVALAAFLAVKQPRVKERDAIALLDRVRDFLDDDPPPLRVPWELAHTVYLHALERDVGRRLAATKKPLVDAVQASEAEE